MREAALRRARVPRFIYKEYLNENGPRGSHQKNGSGPRAGVSSSARDTAAPARLLCVCTAPPSMTAAANRRLWALGSHVTSSRSASSTGYKEFTSEEMHHVFTVPEEAAVKIMPASMHKATSDIFEALGLPADDAAACADTLLYADTRGIDSHGVSNMMKAYVHWCKASPTLAGGCHRQRQRAWLRRPQLLSPSRIVASRVITSESWLLAVRAALPEGRLGQPELDDEDRARRAGHRHH
jgi:hypothetical protein